MSLGEAVVTLAFLIVVVTGWLVYKGLPAYMLSYLAEKGKHLVTHEDLELLLEQIKQTTRAPEEIKTVLSEDLWVRQEQWKLKRDTYLKAITAVGELFNIKLRIYQAEQGHRGETPEERIESLRGLSDEQKRVLAEFRSARAAAAIVLTEEATAVMDNYQRESSQRSVVAPDFSERSMAALNRTYTELVRLARQELRIPTAPPVES
jgi:hypothetical protein